MRTKRIARGLGLAVLGLALVGTPTVMAAGRGSGHAGLSTLPTTRMVAKDGHANAGNCNGGGPAYTKIQDAVNAAASGDTILVCPGVYQEHVTIVGFHGLVIRSTVPFGATIKTPKVLSQDYLVGIGLSQNVLFQGFHLLAVARADRCEALPIGILTSQSTGIVIRGNRVQTTGSKTLTGPCGYFVGIQVGDKNLDSSEVNQWGPTPPDPNAPSRATVAFNLVENFRAVGISVGGKNTYADVLNNSAHYFHVKDPNSSSGCGSPPASSTAGMLAMGRMGAAAMGISGSATCFSVGIMQFDKAAGQIRGNAVLSGPNARYTPSDKTPLLLMGIVQMDQRHEAGKSSVENNQVFRTLVGVILMNGDGTHVSGNHVWMNGVGVFLNQTQGVTVEGNRANRNGAGFGVNDGAGLMDYGRTSSGNTFKNNDARHNNLIGRASNDTRGYNPDFISCFDNTGDESATNPVDNTWTLNKGEPNSSDPHNLTAPLGLCETTL